MQRFSYTISFIMEIHSLIMTFPALDVCGLFFAVASFTMQRLECSTDRAEFEGCGVRGIFKGRRERESASGEGK